MKPSSFASPLAANLGCRWLSVAISVLLLTATALPQSVPHGIKYQGQLTDAAGKPLSAQDRVLSFCIFGEESAGIVLWEITYDGTGGNPPKVPVVDGYSKVVIKAPTSHFNGTARFVEFQVQGPGKIHPRQRLLSAPYALRAASAASADNASQLAGKSVADFVTLWSQPWSPGDGATEYRTAVGHDVGSESRPKNAYVNYIIKY